MLVCSVQPIRRLDSQSKFQMFTLFCGCITEIHQHTGFCKFSRNIWTNIWSLRKRTDLKFGEVCLYLSPMKLQFLDFIHWMVFDLVFYCVTVETIYYSMSVWDGKWPTRPERSAELAITILISNKPEWNKCFIKFGAFVYLEIMA